MNEESNEPPYIADEFMIGAEGASKTDVLSRPIYHVKTKNENTTKMKKTVILSEEQLNYIRETVTCGSGSATGAPTYAFDDKAFIDKETADHKDIMKKSFPGNK